MDTEWFGDKFQAFFKTVFFFIKLLQLVFYFCQPLNGISRVSCLKFSFLCLLFLNLDFCLLEFTPQNLMSLNKCIANLRNLYFSRRSISRSLHPYLISNLLLKILSIQLHINSLTINIFRSLLYSCRSI